jgi:hypothetical protein
LTLPGANIGSTPVSGVIGFVEAAKDCWQASEQFMQLEWD